MTVPKKYGHNMYHQDGRLIWSSDFNLYDHLGNAASLTGGYYGMKGDFPGGSDGKASVYNAGDLGSIPGLGRFPGEGNGNPLQYSRLENPRDGGAWCRLLFMGSQSIRHD